jgi:hypothetical protein
VIANEQLPDRDGVRRTKWLITRDSYPKLRDTTIKTWLTWFPEEVWGSFTWSPPYRHILRADHPSGDGTRIECEAIFIAIDSPEVAASIAASFEITGFWVNEGQFTDKKIVDELMGRTARYPTRMMGPGATWYGGMIDLNAPIEGHWIPYMRGDIPLPKELAERDARRYQKPDRWRFFVQPPGLIERKVDGQIVYEENPAAENRKWLTKGYMEQIEGKDKEWIDRFVLNKTGLYTDGKPVYPNFSADEHLAKKPLVFNPAYELFCGLDFGRDPAAVFGQLIGDTWFVLGELPGDNEAASDFAPRVKKYIASNFPGAKVIFGGDPRGADGTQATETTAYDVFLAHGMRVLPATTDNNPEMRRSAVNAVLRRRNGLQIGEALILKTGMSGGYHYPQIRGTGIYGERPRKNRYSHTVEAFENMVLIGGEGTGIVRGSSEPAKPVRVGRRRVKMRRYG